MNGLARYETRDGPMFAFEGDRYLARSLQLYGEFSPRERELFQQLVKPGMTVVEAGANIGSHTVALARACAPGLLYAFEPQQAVFQVLCANLVANGVDNVVARPEGLGEARGYAVVPLIDYAAGGNFGAVSLQPDGQAGVRTPVSPLDELGLAACGLLKIDVEGYEPQVIKGAVQTIRRCRPILYVENDRPQNQQEIIDLIHGLDYRMYWHTPPLFDADNFNGASENVFPGVVSLNLLCLPAERPSNLPGAPIDPKNWRSPVKLKG